ncbi:DUF4254 domain-containing protein [Nocardia otitidiscaviarum]|uniref:DUF4254 domain-containing protein n=1 Tax=Nocardia otitidiscaviarum TaxID=1823 RepID=UPI000694F847|nr:DUF4254 domain-containing protein [Nocardia otitidiscaviarum]MBF6133223.1 DUF4254 domain-containing protein [Nocardia otitidiscaviarum]MBF6486619.1 DUF4254 domain-containing protein [Nocardia otitidiscaviarum]
MTTDYGAAVFGDELPVSGTRLPAPATLLRAFRDPVTTERPDREVLDAAHELVRCHECRRHAQQAAHAAGATPRRVAECSQLVENIDARRGELVERIDTWVAANIAHRSGASLHTETLGAVIDRMAAKWVAAQQALGMPSSSARPPTADGRPRTRTGPHRGDGPPVHTDDGPRGGADDFARGTGTGREHIAKNGDDAARRNGRRGVDRETHLLWYRLAELADGYRDLITDVAEHRRRLPVW